VQVRCGARGVLMLAAVAGCEVVLVITTQDTLVAPSLLRPR
jgi:hypothetical protein